MEERIRSRKQQILHEAARLFHKNGYRGTSLQQIAEKVGMEGPSLYNHISSKNELLTILLMSNARKFDERMRDIYASSLDALSKLEHLISLHVELTLEDPDAMALMLNEWTHLDEADKTEYLQLRDRYEKSFRSILQESMDNGKIHTMDTNFLLFMILSTLRSLYAWCARYPEYNRVELENYLKRGIMQGILAG